MASLFRWLHPLNSAMSDARRMAQLRAAYRIAGAFDFYAAIQSARRRSHAAPPAIRRLPGRRAGRARSQSLRERQLTLILRPLEPHRRWGGDGYQVCGTNLWHRLGEEFLSDHDYWIESVRVQPRLAVVPAGSNNAGRARQD